MRRAAEMGTAASSRTEGQGGAVAGCLGTASSGAAVSTEIEQGGWAGQWTTAGPGKAPAWWASFKVEGGFGPWPFIKKTFCNSIFFIICKPIRIQIKFER
jgi:hypothetical protein